MVSDSALKKISIAFYPTSIAIPLIVIFAWGNFLEMILAIIFISLMPFFLTAYYAKKQKVNADIFEQHKRHVPFALSIASFLSSSLIFWYLNHTLLFALSLAYLNVTLALLLINLKWKISVHCAGVAGFATDFTYVFGFLLAPLFLLVPLIAWVRYRMNAHTFWQLAAGTIVSAVISFLVFSAVYPL